MSYILDALNKSQKERSLGQVPTLASPPGTSATGSGTASNHLLLAAVALALVAVVIALYAAFAERNPTPPTPTQTPPTAAPVRPQMPPTPSADAADPAGGTGNPSRAPTAPRADGAPPPAREKAAQPTPSRTQTPARQDAADTPDKRDFRADLERIREELIRDLEEPAAPAQSEPEAEPEPETAVTSEASASQPMEADTPGILIEFEELPPAMQQTIPPHRISVHVYSDTPEKRFIILNSRKTVEGGQTGDGLKVVKILADGVVLEYQGQRFLRRR